MAKKKVLIIGLGIGQLYADICSNSKNFKPVTVDINPEKNADFKTIAAALAKHESFHMGIVCLPNNLHWSAAEKIRRHCDVVLVEKPGTKNFASWSSLGDNVYMIKNNMFRDEAIQARKYVDKFRDDIQFVELNWLNSNRIPNPGGWFTDRVRAFSGVSSDLLPHMLSLYYSIFDDINPVKVAQILQRYTMADVSDTNYGTVNLDGVYDVDDTCNVSLTNIGEYVIPTFINVAWKTDLPEDLIDIRIYRANGHCEIIKLGLCPEVAYMKMLNYFSTLTPAQGDEQSYVDSWIIRELDKIKEKYYGKETSTEPVDSQF